MYAFEKLTLDLQYLHVMLLKRTFFAFMRQAQTSNGPNAGYRFPGSGVAVYEDTIQDSVCTYGGLTFAYDVNTVRFWRPTDITNGGVVCVPSLYGHGRNSESNSDVTLVVQIWVLFISK